MFVSNADIILTVGGGGGSRNRKAAGLCFAFVFYEPLDSRDAFFTCLHSSFSNMCATKKASRALNGLTKDERAMHLIYITIRIFKHLIKLNLTLFPSPSCEITIRPSLVCTTKLYTTIKVMHTLIF